MAVEGENVLVSLPWVYRLDNVQEVLERNQWDTETSHFDVLQRYVENRQYRSFASEFLMGSVIDLNYNRSELEKVRVLVEQATAEAHDEVLQALKRVIRDMILFQEPNFPEDWKFYSRDEEHKEKMLYLCISITIRYFYDLPIIQELGISEGMLEIVERRCSDVSQKQIWEESKCKTCQDSQERLELSDIEDMNYDGEYDYDEEIEYYEEKFDK